MDIDPAAFRHCYKYCCLTRNLQILGAFAYLSRVKQKTYFEQYIPRAFKTLKQSLAGSENDEFQALKACVNELSSLRSSAVKRGMDDGRWTMDDGRWTIDDGR